MESQSIKNVQCPECEKSFENDKPVTFVRISKCDLKVLLLKEKTRQQPMILWAKSIIFVQLHNGLF